MASPAFCPTATDACHPSVRDSYLCFSAWTQRTWTLFTGKPLPHQRPLWNLSPALAMVLDLGLATVVCWLHLSMLAADDPHMATYWLTPVFALYLTGRLRKAQVVYGHHAIHGTLFRQHSQANALAARLLTIAALAQNDAEYKREHLDHHRRTIFTTLSDADASLLYTFGLRPGLPFNTLRRSLLITLISPRYHLWFLRARLLSNLRRPPQERALTLAWLTVVCVIVPTHFGVAAAALALWLPLTVLYQMSALLQFVTEHVWLVGEAPGADARAYLERCHGRFCGERVPGTGGTLSSASAWMTWWCRTLFVHLPTRMAVLVGDLPAHDWHHLVAALGHSANHWPQAIYERQRAIDCGHTTGMETRELWGMNAMVRHVLSSMSRAPALSDAGGLRHEETSPVKSP